MPKVKLAKISSQSFEHEADRKALEALRKTAGFDRLIHALAKFHVDRVFGVIAKSSSVKVGPKQVPTLYKLFEEVCANLDIAPVPDLYLGNSPAMNAMCAGVERPVIMVTSALVDAMSDAEIQCVLGHELGHYMAGHVLYRIVADNIKNIMILTGQLTFGIGTLLELGLMSGLMYWARCAELTCDRAGLLAVQDPAVAKSVMMKLSGGNAGRFSRELDLEAFLAQARETAIDDDRWTNVMRGIIENDLTHPWPVVRAREIERWVDEGHYGRILEGDYLKRAQGAIADGPHPAAGADGEAGAAAAAEAAIRVVLARAYGVHVAPRIPEGALHVALGAFVGHLAEHERVLAFYDDTFTGAGDKGVVLTNLRIFTSDRPQVGIRYSDIEKVEEIAAGLLSRPGLKLDELELRFHSRDVRDAFKSAIVAGMEVHRPRT